MTMIIIRNSNGSVCCRTSNPEHLCQKCKQQYQQLRNEDQSDMLIMPTLNFATGEIERVGVVVNDVRQQQKAVPERESSFTTNDVWNPEASLSMPQIKFSSGEIYYPFVVNDVINEQQQSVPTGNRTEELDQNDLLLMPKIDYGEDR
jgi:hypothetical protein